MIKQSVIDELLANPSQQTKAIAKKLGCSPAMVSIMRKEIGLERLAGGFSKIAKPRQGSKAEIALKAIESGDLSGIDIHTLKYVRRRYL